MRPLTLFSAYGIELEYMIAARDTLKVDPVADQLFSMETGQIGSEVEHNEIAWSNELAMHVVEIKCNGPRKDLQSLPALFQREINLINQHLSKLNAQLLPSGMHPWMNPLEEAKLWPHEQNEIYQSYNKIFNCKGHGWVNLQSTHLNLPFSDDDSFARLHTAIRLVLPLLPALAASTPFCEGEVSGYLDTRLHFYNQNQKRIPQISGHIIPEFIPDQSSYQERILKPTYQAIAPFDPHGLLQDEWLNSRGAIARFDRMAIEIRLLDIQECPQMDLAIIALIVEVIKALVEERWCTFQTQASWHETDLAEIYHKALRTGGQTILTDPEYLSLFGIQKPATTINSLWYHLSKQLLDAEHWAQSGLEIVLKQGCLAERMLKVYQAEPTPTQLFEIYQELAVCLATGQPYEITP